jgi:hypothetical protein
MKDNWVEESVTVAVQVALCFDPNRVARERVVAQAEKDLSRAVQRISGAYRIEGGEAKHINGSWIPVSERDPGPMPIGSYVFVKIAGYFYPAVARRLPSGMWETSDGRQFASWEVTHYMPAPPAD